MAFERWIDGQGKVRIRRVSSPPIDYADLTNAPAPPIRSVKTITETRANVTALSNDADLRLQVNANTSYALTGVLMFVAGTAVDARMRFTSISGAELRYTRDLDNTTAGQALFNTSYLIPTNTGNRQTTISGVLMTGSSGGELVLQWAQNVSSASALTLRKGSYLMLTPLT